ncbi:MAG: Mur ligase domain-containing protein [Bilophila sp.]
MSTDSRDVTPGSLFVCIPGETFDGHDFAGKAAEAGAAALLASRNPFDGTLPVPVVLVEDTVKALWAARALLARRLLGQPRDWTDRDGGQDHRQGTSRSGAWPPGSDGPHAPQPEQSDRPAPVHAGGHG